MWSARCVLSEQADEVAPCDLGRLTTVYGPTTGDVYDRLDASLDRRDLTRCLTRLAGS